MSDAIRKLEDEARFDAVGISTGKATLGAVTVRYYPVCKRFRWFDQKQPILKREAVKMLELLGKPASK